MNDRKFKAWAIDLKTKEGHGFVGRYLVGTPIPKHMKGCVTALFETRSSARKNLDYVRQGNIFPNAQVVRVEVTIKEV